MLVIIICTIVWIYILTVLSRAKLAFFKFLLGSVGMFILIMFSVQSYITVPLAHAVAASAGIFGDLTGTFNSYYQYAIIFIEHGANSISLYIDYECSGVIEILAFSSLLWFFPLYHPLEKLYVNVLGIFWIFAANVLRVVIICLLVYFFGNDIYFFAHALFGRIVFYLFSIVLYFYVFTRPQIVRQKVGKFNYGNNTSEDI